MLRVELVRARNNNAGTSPASRVGLQRMSAASTGTIAAGDKMDPLGQTPANVTQFTRSTTATGTLAGNPLVIVDAGDARDWCGAWSPPRPWAAILLFEGVAALTAEDKLGFVNLTAKQSGGNWQVHVAHDQAEHGPRLRTPGRRPRHRDCLIMRPARQANISRAATAPRAVAVGKRYDEYTVERACGYYWRNAHRANSPNFQAAPASGGTTIVNADTAVSSWAALDATITIKAAADTPTAAFAPLAPAAKQNVSATTAISSWATFDATTKVTETASTAIASWSALAATAAQVVQATLAISTWQAIDATPKVTETATVAVSAWQALDASTRVTETASVAVSAWQAFDASFAASAGVVATTAISSWQAIDASATITETATVAASAWQVFNATVTLTESANVAASAWQALDASVTVTETATCPVSSWQALDASFTASGGVIATVAVVSWSALDASAKVTETATLASSAWQAFNPAVSLVATSATSTVTWQALDASIRVTHTATTTIIAWQGLSAAFSRTATPPTITTAWLALDASPTITISADASAVSAWNAIDADSFAGRVATQIGRLDAPAPLGIGGQHLVGVDAANRSGLSPNKPRGLGA